MDGAIDELKLKLKSDNGQQSVDLYNREKNMIVGKDSLHRIIKSPLSFYNRTDAKILNKMAKTWKPKWKAESTSCILNIQKTRNLKSKMFLKFKSCKIKQWEKSWIVWIRKRWKVWMIIRSLGFQFFQCSWCMDHGRCNESLS